MPELPLTETLLNLSDWNLSTLPICFLVILVLRRGLAAIVINNNNRKALFLIIFNFFVLKSMASFPIIEQDSFSLYSASDLPVGSDHPQSPNYEEELRMRFSVITD